MEKNILQNLIQNNMKLETFIILISLAIALNSFIAGALYFNQAHNKKTEKRLNDLVKKYNEQLTNKLRDFGETHLKYWIPDENIYLSIPKLIFSIHNSNWGEFIYNQQHYKLLKDFICIVYT